jgi:hypothetical protein
VATGLYHARDDLFATLEEPRLAPLKTAIADSPPGTLFCGELRPAWLSTIDEHYRGDRGEAVVLPGPADSIRRAGYLAELAWQLVTDGLVDDVATLQPLYLRRPSVSGSAAASVGGAVG